MFFSLSLGVSSPRRDTQEASYGERRMDEKKMLRLLCFTTHPDDEGGLLVLCCAMPNAGLKPT
jgi:hypothetical protein